MTAPTAKALACCYDRLTPDERFKLMLAARGRNDEAEEDRLIHAGETIPVRMRDIFPHLMAFQTVSMLAFIELLDHAADAEAAWFAAESSVESEERAERWGRIANVFGYRLRVKWLGWIRFCEEMTVPPRHFWVGLPGLERIERSLQVAELMDCSDAEFLAIVNAGRKPSRAEVTEVGFTVEAAATTLRQMFDGHLELHSVK
jgi:hypothetical protein